MHDELPEHLKTTCELLTRSLLGDSIEKASAMPASLARDLSVRFAAPAEAMLVAAPIPWYHKVRMFFITPAFGLAAVAIILLGVTLPMAVQPPAMPENFRGAAGSPVGEPAKIIFIGENASVRSAVESSGRFELAAISSVKSVKLAYVQTGPKIVVDFTAGTVTSVSQDGVKKHAAPIPAEAADLADAIAAALSHL
jgi:hypothetical protein